MNDVGVEAKYTKTIEVLASVAITILVAVLCSVCAIFLFKEGNLISDLNQTIAQDKG